MDVAGEAAATADPCGARAAAQVRSSLPAAERARLAILDRFAIVGTDPEPEFDRLARIAVDACQADLGGITFLDGDHGWMKAAVNLPEPAISRELSMSSRVVAARAPVVIPDLTADTSAPASYCTAIHGQGAYLGAPIIDRDGVALGSAWVSWTQPRAIDPHQVSVLEGIADAVVTLLVHRSERRQLEQLGGRRQRELVEERGQRRVLRDLASDAPIEQVLDGLACSLEEVLPGSRASVLLLDGEVLRDGAGPSLPESYRHAIDGIQVSTEHGACGPAVVTGRTVISPDLLRDPRWRSYRHLLEHVPIRACWSVPIAGPGERCVLGTLVVYRDEPAAPTADVLGTMDRFAALAGLAIEHRQSRRELERRMRILDEVSDAVLVLEPSSLRVVSANDAALAALGAAGTPVVGRSPDELLPAVAAERARQLVEPIVAGASDRASSPVELRRPDGSLLLGEVRAHLIDGQLVLVLRDLTEPRTLDDALRRTERLLHDLAERSREGIYRLRVGEEDGPRYEYVNAAFAGFLGVSVDEVLADAEVVLGRIHPDDLDQLSAAALRGDTRPREIRVTRPDGSVAWVQASELPLRDERGELIGVQGIVIDVTERRREQQTLAAALEREREVAEQLRELDELKNGFLRAVSHELRTPLTAVLGFAHTLRDHDDLPAGLREELLDRLVRNADRLGSLLADLLDVDRLGRGAGLGIRRPVDLTKLLREAADELEAADHDVEVVGERCVSEVDRALVTRVVANLLQNAVRHTPPGTRIRASTSCDDSGATLTVEDDGPGVAEELREAIFEPFRQGPGSGEMPAPGTGIGLALVARVAELHGGRAWAESSPLGGVAFRVWLPAG